MWLKEEISTSLDGWVEHRYATADAMVSFMIFCGGFCEEDTDIVARQARWLSLIFCNRVHSVGSYSLTV